MRQPKQAAWAMIGAVVGAGFASGREIASFFSSYGPWGIVGIVAAVVVIAFMALRIMQASEESAAGSRCWFSRLRTGLFAALLTVTGGTMLAAAGEVASLLLPVHGASILGTMCTMALGYWLAIREIRGLARVSQVLTACLVGVILSGWWIAPVSAVVVTAPVGLAQVPETLLRGLCYGGLNMALAVPVLEEVSRTLSATQRKRCVIIACSVLGMLLLAGHAVLLRHPALISEALPFLRLTEALGLWGYGLSALSLYLAMLTTLTSCLRGLRAMLRPGWCVLLPLGVVPLGFSQAVEWLYPLLGAGCFLLLALDRRKAL